MQSFNFKFIPSDSLYTPPVEQSQDTHHIAEGLLHENLYDWNFACDIPKLIPSY